MTLPAEHHIGAQDGATAGLVEPCPPVAADADDHHPCIHDAEPYRDT